MTELTTFMEDSLVDASSIPPLEEEDETEKPAADGDSQEEKKLSVGAELRILGSCLWEKAWFQIAALSTEATSWGVLVVLAAVYLAMDPLGLMAHLLDFYPQGCKPHECLLPVPHVNEWPADPASKLLNCSVAFHTVVPGPESLAWDAQVESPFTSPNLLVSSEAAYFLLREIDHITALQNVVE